MRTTVTLDDDVAVRLRRLAKRSAASFKEVLNEALRRGLDVLARPSAATEPYRVRPWNLGGSAVGSLDNVEEVLSRVEGEGHR